jgi:hypothetical protein
MIMNKKGAVYTILSMAVCTVLYHLKHSTVYHAYASSVRRSIFLKGMLLCRMRACLLQVLSDQRGKPLPTGSVSKGWPFPLQQPLLICCTTAS